MKKPVNKPDPGGEIVNFSVIHGKKEREEEEKGKGERVRFVRIRALIKES
jgi:hypothetical protein